MPQNQIAIRAPLGTQYGPEWYATRIANTRLGFATGEYRPAVLCGITSQELQSALLFVPDQWRHGMSDTEIAEAVAAILLGGKGGEYGLPFACDRAKGGVPPA